MGRLSAPGPSVFQLCHNPAQLVSDAIGVCAACLRESFPKARPLVEAAQIRSRVEFRLPEKPPRTPGGVRCTLCSNECQMSAGETDAT
jgi:pyruvate formate lyase activating enzyme